MTDLAVMLALGGDCLADAAMLRAEPALFGPVASGPVISRLVTRLAADAPRALKAIRAARAAARDRAWALAGGTAPGADGGMVTIDIDATIVTACSEKDQAAPTWKKTFGFHPLTVFADHGPGGGGEPLAILLRPGNAGSNTAADHIEATRLGLAQLPARQRRHALIRTDCGGGTHGFLTWLTSPGRRLQYSVGFTMTSDICDAIGKLPARAWTPAYNGDRQVRPGAWVAELTGMLNLQGWPKGRPQGAPAPRRAAAVHRHRRPPLHVLRHQHPRRPAPRPGTAPPAPGPVRGPDPLRQRHRPAEPPLHSCTQNQIWCEIVALACDLLAWTQMLALTGAAAGGNPGGCGSGLFAAPGRIARGGRRLRLRLAAHWPWATIITAGLTRLSYPAPG